MRPLVTVGVALLTLSLPACGGDRVRVACVGDSITRGAGLDDPDRDAYPAQLQRRLGRAYRVRNYGVDGATLLARGDLPYVREKAYRDALASRPNVVVIALGSNDAKPHNWAYAEEFEGDYRRLVDSFRMLDSAPRVVLCVPPPAFPEAFGIADDAIRDRVRPKVLAVGKELGLPVVDLYAELSGRPELFPDRVHPDAEGARLIAEAVARAVAGGGDQ